MSNRLLQVFVGEFVEILTSQQVTIEKLTEDGPMTKTKPLVTTGYFIDVDDEWIYLGDTPNQAQHAIQLRDAVEISIGQRVDKYDEALDEYNVNGEVEN